MQIIGWRATRFPIVRAFSGKAYEHFANMLRDTDQPKEKSTLSFDKTFSDFLEHKIHKSCSDTEINAFAGECVKEIHQNSLSKKNILNRKEKQEIFAETLKDFDKLLKSINERYFLAAGTALGALRDGKFIEHDDDIDIGIFHENSTGISALLQALSVSFEPFQVLGHLDHGLEVRLIHKITKVKIDMNWFYLEKSFKESFLWCATYYGDSDQRKHKCYRYKHIPFELSEVTLHGGTYLVPPIHYLEEYYGKDWKTPKKFDYWEGLAGEYKNIIDE